MTQVAKLVVESVNAIAWHSLVSEFLEGIKVINTLKQIFGHTSRDKNFLLLSSELTLRKKNPTKKRDYFLPFWGVATKKQQAFHMIFH